VTAENVNFALSGGRVAAATILCALLGACAVGDSRNAVREVWLSPSGSEWRTAAIQGVTLYRTDKSTSQVVPAPVIARLLAAIDRLEKAGGSRADLALAESEPPNAFAFSFEGRPIIAYSLGWLDKLGHDADAIAAVAAHELAHLQLGHSAAERSARDKSAQVAGQVTGLILRMIGVPFGGALSSAVASAYAQSFTQDEERAAGELALKSMLAAGYDPCGMRRVVRLYESLEGEAPHPWLHAHRGAEEAASQSAVTAGRKSCA